MEWEDRQESSNVDDRRGMGGGARAGIAAGGGGLLLLVVAMLLPPEYRQVFMKIFGGGGEPGQVQQDPNNKPGPRDPEEEKQARFTKVILKDTEDVWNELFSKAGKKYEEPTLVLFSGSVKSACGFADAAVGPFYCPGDHRLYIDLAFYKDMADRRKLDAPGDFARAFVVAHEVGHHVQNLLGYSKIADKHRGTKLENQYSVRLELQADYLAGVWANHIQKLHKNKYDVLNERDIKDGANAAFKIGDDYLQSKARGTVYPEKFTHGKAKARMYWLLDGIKTGEFSKAKLDKFFTLPYDEVDVGEITKGR